MASLSRRSAAEIGREATAGKHVPFQKKPLLAPEIWRLSGARLSPRQFFRHASPRNIGETYCGPFYCTRTVAAMVIKDQRRQVPDFDPYKKRLQAIARCV